MPPLDLAQMEIDYGDLKEAMDTLPHEQRERIMKMVVSKASTAAEAFLRGWEGLAEVYIELKAMGAPAEAQKVMAVLGVTAGEAEQMVQAYQARRDPRYAPLLTNRRSYQAINGIVSNEKSRQLTLSTDVVTVELESLDPDSLGGKDVLPVHPTLAGATGEDGTAALLDRIGLKYESQKGRCYLCDFGESKRPDFSVSGISARNDNTLSAGFYIETTLRLHGNSKDLSLFYLLHQIVSYADLPTIVIFDGPNLSDRVIEWARRFSKERKGKSNKAGGQLYWVATQEQFREWVLRKIGRQS